MKKIFAIITLALTSVIANAQNKVLTLVTERGVITIPMENTSYPISVEKGQSVDVVYPSEWGEVTNGKFVPVLRADEIYEPFLMLHTGKGVGFISHKGKCFFVPALQDVTVKEVKVNGKTYYQAPNGDLCVEGPKRKNEWGSHISGAYFDA